MSHPESTVARGTTAAFAKYAEGLDSDLRMSQHRSVFITELEPKYLEFARMRRLYGANTGAGTATAPVQALPTTTASWALYNPATNTKVLVPLRAYCWSVSGTAGLGMAMLIGNLTTEVATASIPTSYTNSVSKALMPNSAATNAIFGSAVTVPAPTWNVAAARAQVAAVEVGSGLSVELNGMYVVEPGFALVGDVLAPAGVTALFGFGFIWGELDLTLA